MEEFWANCSLVHLLGCSLFHLPMDWNCLKETTLDGNMGALTVIGFLADSGELEAAASLELGHLQ